VSVAYIRFPIYIHTANAFTMNLRGRGGTIKNNNKKTSEQLSVAATILVFSMPEKSVFRLPASVIMSDFWKIQGIMYNWVMIR